MGTLHIKIKAKHMFSFRKLSMGHRNWDVLYLLLFLLFWNLHFEPKKMGNSNASTGTFVWNVLD